MTTTAWIPVCDYDVLLPERGAAAIVDGQQVALFRLVDGTVHAVGHHDPFSGANVMARGIVGSRGDLPTVTSPIHKQTFDLGSGRCLDVDLDIDDDDDSQVTDPVSLPTWPVRVRDGVLEVAMEVTAEVTPEVTAEVTAGVTAEATMPAIGSTVTIDT